MRPYNQPLDPEVEDIFDQAKTSSAPQLQPQLKPRPIPVQPVPASEPEPEIEYEYQESFYQTVSGKIAIIALVVVVLAIIGVVLYKYTSLFDFSQPEEVINTPVETNLNKININTAPVVEYPLIDDTSPEVDADGDGLSDTLEVTEYQTDPQKIDTDGDGLTDREEVKVYLTDPLDSDTDGDGYSDGEEVSRFYNPLGSGKLLNLNKAINELNNE